MGNTLETRGGHVAGDLHGRRNTGGGHIRGQGRGGNADLVLSPIAPPLGWQGARRMAEGGAAPGAKRAIRRDPRTAEGPFARRRNGAGRELPRGDGGRLRVMRSRRAHPFHCRGMGSPLGRVRVCIPTDAHTDCPRPGTCAEA